MQEMALNSEYQWLRHTLQELSSYIGNDKNIIVRLNSALKNLGKVASWKPAFHILWAQNQICKQTMDIFAICNGSLSEDKGKPHLRRHHFEAIHRIIAKDRCKGYHLREATRSKSDKKMMTRLSRRCPIFGSRTYPSDIFIWGQCSTYGRMNWQQIVNSSCGKWENMPPAFRWKIVCTTVWDGSNVASQTLHIRWEHGCLEC